jgi:hypothetical protein
MRGIWQRRRWLLDGDAPANLVRISEAHCNAGFLGKFERPPSLFRRSTGNAFSSHLINFSGYCVIVPILKPNCKNILTF